MAKPLLGGEGKNGSLADAGAASVAAPELAHVVVGAFAVLGDIETFAFLRGTRKRTRTEMIM